MQKADAHALQVPRSVLAVQHAGVRQCRRHEVWTVACQRRHVAEDVGDVRAVFDHEADDAGEEGDAGGEEHDEEPAFVDPVDGAGEGGERSRGVGPWII